jgi:hypothetical protein
MFNAEGLDIVCRVPDTGQGIKVLQPENLYQNKIRSLMRPDLYMNHRLPITDY